MPIGHGQSCSQLSQSSPIAASQGSPSMSASMPHEGLKQSSEQLISVSPWAQHPSPQIGAQSSGQVQLSSRSAWQQPLPQVATGQSAGQLHSSPASQVPSPQPLHGGPQDCPMGQPQSIAQPAQSSPLAASQEPSPQNPTSWQSIGQEAKDSPPPQQPSPHTARQSVGQPQLPSPGSHVSPSPSKSGDMPPHPSQRKLGPKVLMQACPDGQAQSAGQTSQFSARNMPQVAVQQPSPQTGPQAIEAGQLQTVSPGSQLGSPHTWPAAVRVQSAAASSESVPTKPNRRMGTLTNGGVGRRMGPP
jgi:hypothetical protein